MRARTVLLLASAGAALAWLRPFRVAVAGESMEPQLHDGDELVVLRPGRLRRGDVVVVRRGPLELVKRVAGLPGERVEAGSLSWRLAPDEILVLGDNPGRSTDARSFGPLPRTAIVGRVVLRYRPRPGLIGRGVAARR